MGGEAKVTARSRVGFGLRGNPFTGSQPHALALQEPCDRHPRELSQDQIDDRKGHGVKCGRSVEIKQATRDLDPDREDIDPQRF